MHTVHTEGYTTVLCLFIMTVGLSLGFATADLFARHSTVNTVMHLINSRSHGVNAPFGFKTIKLVQCDRVGGYTKTLLSFVIYDMKSTRFIIVRQIVLFVEL